MSPGPAGALGASGLDALRIDGPQALDEAQDAVEFGSSPPRWFGVSSMRASRAMRATSCSWSHGIPEKIEGVAERREPGSTYSPKALQSF